MYILLVFIELYRIISSENPPWGSGNEVGMYVVCHIHTNLSHTALK